MVVGMRRSKLIETLLPWHFDQRRRLRGLRFTGDKLKSWQMIREGSSCPPADHSFASIPANFSRTFVISSGLARATRGKSLSRSNGRQASMIARELVETKR
jgi:hypothetical protein